MPTAGTLPANLASQLKRAERRKRLFSISLTLPLLVFLVVIFIVPIGALLIRAVENPEVANTLGRTGAALAQWDRKSAPPDTAYASLAQDLAGSRMVTQPGVIFNKQTGQLANQNASPALPPGMVKQIGTSGGKPVYLDKNGKQVIAKG